MAFLCLPAMSLQSSAHNSWGKGFDLLLICNGCLTALWTGRWCLMAAACATTSALGPRWFVRQSFTSCCRMPEAATACPSLPLPLCSCCHTTRAEPAQRAAAIQGLQLHHRRHTHQGQTLVDRDCCVLVPRVRERFTAGGGARQVRCTLRPASCGA